MRDLLFEKYCRGTLAPDETRALKEELSTSAEAREAIARHLEERFILVRLCGRKARRRAVVRPAPPTRRPWIPAAAAIAAVILGLLVSSPAPAPKPHRTTTIAPPPPVAAAPSPRVEAPRLVVEPPRYTPPAPLIAPRFEAAPPERPAVRMTVAAVAVVESASEATLAKGQDILPGGSLSTGPQGSALLRFPDGTRLELSASTSVRDVESARMTLAEGTIAAEVVKRPADRPLVVATSRGRATVLGTTFRMTAGASTRLEVTEGRVRLSSVRDGESVDVAAGQYGLITERDEVLLRSLPRLVHAEEFDRMPAWSSTDHATWGAAAVWSLGAGQKGSGLLAARSARGSSVVAVVYKVPANVTLEISVFMKCPKLQGRQWMECGVRLGEHRASDFDAQADRWILVKKFDVGNGGVWSRQSAVLETGSFTRITVAFKAGSHDGGAPTVGWDGLRIAIP